MFLGVLASVTLGAVAFAVTWFIAPQAGGEFWPYVRFLASAVVAVFVFKTVSAIVGLVVGRMQMKQMEDQMDGMLDDEFGNLFEDNE